MQTNTPQSITFICRGPRCESPRSSHAFPPSRSQMSNFRTRKHKVSVSTSSIECNFHWCIQSPMHLTQLKTIEGKYHDVKITNPFAHQFNRGLVIVGICIVRVLQNPIPKTCFLLASPLFLYILWNTSLVMSRTKFRIPAFNHLDRRGLGMLLRVPKIPD